MGEDWLLCEGAMQKNFPEVQERFTFLLSLKRDFFSLFTVEPIGVYLSLGSLYDIYMSCFGKTEKKNQRNQRKCVNILLCCVTKMMMKIKWIPVSLNMTVIQEKLSIRIPFIDMRYNVCNYICTIKTQGQIMFMSFQTFESTFSTFGTANQVRLKVEVDDHFFKQTKKNLLNWFTLKMQYMQRNTKPILAI